MSRYSVRGAGLENTYRALEEGKDFKTSGALSAEAYPFYVREGRLDKYEREILAGDSHRGIRYVVYSYGTPIAWVCFDGSTHYVHQRFSVTTSKHQALTRGVALCEDYEGEPLLNAEEGEE